MEWVKLYTRTPRDPAVRAADQRHPHALRLFVLGLCYAGEQETDGVIPESEPAYWGVPSWRKAADALVAEGLWDGLLEGGWLIPNFLKYQQSKEEAEESRRKAAERQRRKRERDRHTVTDGVSHATREEERREVPPLPPQAGGFRTACDRHKARPKAGCHDCQRPAPTRPAETRLADLCDLHGRDKATCPWCPTLPLEVGP